MYIVMDRLLRLADMEPNQHFDHALVKHLAEVLEFLPNIEN